MDFAIRVAGGLRWVIRMYDYTVNPFASNEVFSDVCKKIESIYHGIQKEHLLVDVDGTAIQIYWLEGNKMKVFNDYEVDAVYV